MSRFLQMDLVMFALAVAFMAMSARAHADVLEIGTGGGATWVSGGPSQISGARSLSPVAVPPKSYETVASESAVPERWRLKIAEPSARYDVSAALPEALVWQESRWQEGAVSPMGALGWLQGTLLGNEATAVGFMMLTGRMNWRFGATVIIGCFILFGASAIVSGIQQAAD